MHPWLRTWLASALTRFNLPGLQSKSKDVEALKLWLTVRLPAPATHGHRCSKLASREYPVHSVRDNGKPEETAGLDLHNVIQLQGQTQPRHSKLALSSMRAKGFLSQ